MNDLDTLEYIGERVEHLTSVTAELARIAQALADSAAALERLAAVAESACGPLET
jgi:hypothetical protein